MKRNNSKNNFQRKMMMDNLQRKFSSNQEQGRDRVDPGRMYSMRKEGTPMANFENFNRRDEEDKENIRGVNLFMDKNNFVTLSRDTPRLPNHDELVDQIVSKKKSRLKEKIKHLQENQDFKFMETGISQILSPNTQRGLYSSEKKKKVEEEDTSMKELKEIDDKIEMLENSMAKIDQYCSDAKSKFSAFGASEEDQEEHRSHHFLNPTNAPSLPVNRNSERKIEINKRSSSKKNYSLAYPSRESPSEKSYIRHMRKNPRLPKSSSQASEFGPFDSIENQSSIFYTKKDSSASKTNHSQLLPDQSSMISQEPKRSINDSTILLHLFINVTVHKPNSSRISN